MAREAEEEEVVVSFSSASRWVRKGAEGNAETERASVFSPSSSISRGATEETAMIRESSIECATVAGEEEDGAGEVAVVEEDVDSFVFWVMRRARAEVESEGTSEMR